MSENNKILPHPTKTNVISPKANSEKSSLEGKKLKRVKRFKKITHRDGTEQIIELSNVIKIFPEGKIVYAEDSTESSKRDKKKKKDKNDIDTDLEIIKKSGIKQEKKLPPYRHLSPSDKIISDPYSPKNKSAALPPHNSSAVFDNNAEVSKSKKEKEDGYESVTLKEGGEFGVHLLHKDKKGKNAELSILHDNSFHLARSVSVSSAKKIPKKERKHAEDYTESSYNDSEAASSSERKVNDMKTKIKESSHKGSRIYQNIEGSRVNGKTSGTPLSKVPRTRISGSMVNEVYEKNLNNTNTQTYATAYNDETSSPIKKPVRLRQPRTGTYSTMEKTNTVHEVKEVEGKGGNSPQVRQLTYINSLLSTKNKQTTDKKINLNSEQQHVQANDSILSLNITSNHQVISVAKDSATNSPKLTGYIDSLTLTADKSENKQNNPSNIKSGKKTTNNSLKNAERKREPQKTKTNNSVVKRTSDKNNNKLQRMNEDNISKGKIGPKTPIAKGTLSPIFDGNSQYTKEIQGRNGSVRDDSRKSQNNIKKEKLSNINSKNNKSNGNYQRSRQWENSTLLNDRKEAAISVLSRRSQRSKVSLGSNEYEYEYEYQIVDQEYYHYDYDYDTEIPSNTYDYSTFPTAIQEKSNNEISTNTTENESYKSKSIKDNVSNGVSKRERSRLSSNTPRNRIEKSKLNITMSPKVTIDVKSSITGDYDESSHTKGKNHELNDSQQDINLRRRYSGTLTPKIKTHTYEYTYETVDTDVSQSIREKSSSRAADDGSYHATPLKRALSALRSKNKQPTPREEVLLIRRTKPKGFIPKKHSNEEYKTYEVGDSEMAFNESFLHNENNEKKQFVPVEKSSSKVPQVPVGSILVESIDHRNAKLKDPPIWKAEPRIPTEGHVSSSVHHNSPTPSSTGNQPVNLVDYTSFKNQKVKLAGHELSDDHPDDFFVAGEDVSYDINKKRSDDVQYILKAVLEKKHDDHDSFMEELLEEKKKLEEKEKKTNEKEQANGLNEEEETNNSESNERNNDSEMIGRKASDKVVYENGFAIEEKPVLRLSEEEIARRYYNDPNSDTVTMTNSSERYEPEAFRYKNPYERPSNSSYAKIRRKKKRDSSSMQDSRSHASDSTEDDFTVSSDEDHEHATLRMIAYAQKMRLKREGKKMKEEPKERNEHDLPFEEMITCDYSELY